MNTKAKTSEIFKVGVTSLLAKRATVVLLDPEVSAAQAIAQQAIPRNTGLVVQVELTEYTGEATARYAQVIPGWSVEKTKRMGALLIGFNNNGLSIINVSIELQLGQRESLSY